MELKKILVGNHAKSIVKTMVETGITKFMGELWAFMCWENSIARILRCYYFSWIIVISVNKFFYHTCFVNYFRIGWLNVVNTWITRVTSHELPTFQHQCGTIATVNCCVVLVFFNCHKDQTDKTVSSIFQSLLYMELAFVDFHSRNGGQNESI